MDEEVALRGGLLGLCFAGAVEAGGDSSYDAYDTDET